MYLQADHNAAAKCKEDQCTDRIRWADVVWDLSSLPIVQHHPSNSTDVWLSTLFAHHQQPLIWAHFVVNFNDVIIMSKRQWTRSCNSPTDNCKFL